MLTAQLFSHHPLSSDSTLLLLTTLSAVVNCSSSLRCRRREQPIGVKLAGDRGVLTVTQCRLGPTVLEPGLPPRSPRSSSNCVRRSTCWTPPTSFAFTTPPPTFFTIMPLPQRNITTLAAEHTHRVPRPATPLRPHSRRVVSTLPSTQTTGSRTQPISGNDSHAQVRPKPESPARPSSAGQLFCPPDFRSGNPLAAVHNRPNQQARRRATLAHCDAVGFPQSLNLTLPRDDFEQDPSGRIWTSPAQTYHGADQTIKPVAPTPEAQMARMVRPSVPMPDSTGGSVERPPVRNGSPTVRRYKTIGYKNQSPAVYVSPSSPPARLPNISHRMPAIESDLAPTPPQPIPFTRPTPGLGLLLDGASADPM